MTDQNNKNETASVIPLATKVKKYVESKIVIEPRDKPPYWLWRDKPKEEQLKRELEWYRKWASELKDFFRDHRSQDINDVYVDVTEIDVCSKCGDTWETYVDEDTGDTCCAACGALIKPKQVVYQSGC